ncbi:DUF6801 domain-containing protein [Streptomyces sp. NPDC048277]|uniref:DUF6801 domain-containing protein n=1 Tax=Streptomyces sp. NPDC048277 TaxID=3155027 RepID=UPI0034028F61
MPGELRTGRTVAAAVAGAVLVVAPAVAPGTASAAAAPRTFQYTCTFGLLSGQSMTGSVVWNVSDTHVVGRPTPRLPVAASATVGGLIPPALRTAGATSLEGTAKVHAVVAAPQGDMDITVPMDVPVTQIPPSGSITVPANGTAPSLTFTKAGPAKILAGDIEMRVTPRQADGSETQLGTVNASCSVDSGQDRVVSSFRIRPASSPTPTPTPTPTTSSPSNGSGSGSGSGGGAHGSGSGAGSGTGSGSGSGSGNTGTGGSQGSHQGGASRSPDPGGSAGASGSTSPSASPSASASAVAGGAPTLAAPRTDSDDRTRAQDRTAFPVPLRAALAVLAVAGAAFGSAVWFRRRGDDG